MARTPSGTVHAVATVLASAKAVTAVTNAAEAAFSSATHGFLAGDIVVPTSGWQKINQKPFRVKTVTADSFVLESCDTSNTTAYPAGAGVGSVRKVTTFVELSKTTNHASNGGDAKTATVSFVEDESDTVVVDGANPVQRSFEMDADQIGSPGYLALKSLHDSQAFTVVKRTFKNGAITLFGATVFFSEEESLNQGALVAVRGTFFAKSTNTRYAAP